MNKTSDISHLQPDIKSAMIIAEYHGTKGGNYVHIT